LAAAALRFRAEEAGLEGLDGPVVAVLSGGNVDPDRYREYLAAPLPA
jgi:threonine dehydratase